MIGGQSAAAGYPPGMTEITNPLPADRSGAAAAAQDSHLVDGSPSLVDGGSTGTDEGPAGIPAALVGHDRDGDEVGPPPAALPDGPTGGSTGTGPAEDADTLSPSDTGSPLTASPGRGESAAGDDVPAGREGR